MAAAKKEEKKPIMSCASSGHINKTWAIYFWPFDIYGEIILALGVPYRETDPHNIGEYFSVKQHALKNIYNCLNTKVYSYLETSGDQC